MIQVVYHRDYHRVTVKGHANSGEVGHDLVCAAVSMLSSTLAVNVAHMYSKRLVHEKVIVQDDGYCEISCKTMGKYKYSVMMIFDSVCMGFDLLSQRNPENVQYEIRG